MSWDLFIWFALAATVCWIAGAWFAWKDRSAAANISTGIGLLIFFAFILGMWITLERPPMRTLGETRLWYAFFVPVAGMIVYLRWRYKWILSFSTILAFVFICVNLFKPEIHSKTMMPALQSPWFAPHVIVYMFSYAMLGAATLMAIWQLFIKRFLVKDGKGAGRNRTSAETEMEITDNLVYVGLAFLTFGMLFGALWAKEAWGHYWSWDPKETWAAATWLSYLLYVHYRQAQPRKTENALWILLGAFVCLQICWWGINYLPSARAESVHVYEMK